MKRLHGRCLCGAVEMTVTDAFEYVGYCHCSECRRFSGSAFSAFGRIAKSAVQIVKGRDDIRHYAKSAQTVLGFCAHCGSSLYADKPGSDRLHLRLGVLDEAPAMTPQAHAHVASKAAWFTIGDDLPQFPAARITR